MLDYIIAAVSGLIAGFIFWKLAIIQISKRTKDAVKQNSLKKIYIPVLWMFISAISFVGLVFLYGSKYFPANDFEYVSKVIEYALYISIVFNIAAVDFLIRKIPNELLLYLMLIKVVFVVIALLNLEKTPETAAMDLVFTPLIGLVVGFFLFSIPSMFKINIGAGDVKFSGVIGFCLGYYLFLQAMIIMAIILLGYLLFLLITRKGNLKTATAMGPYLALGAVITILFPLSENLIK